MVAGATWDSYKSRLLACLLILLPFELVIAELGHGLFKGFLSHPALFTQPVVYILAVLVIRRCTLGMGTTRNEAFVAGCLFLMSIPATYHAYRGSQLDLHFLVLGIGGLLAGVELGRGYCRVPVFRFLAIGLTAWCSVIVLVYLIDVFRILKVNPWMSVYRVDQLVLAMRYPESPNIRLHINLWYPLVTGNWNKASNVLVLASLFMVVAIAEVRKFSTLYLACFALMAVVSIQAFSRGGMLVSAIMGGGLLLAASSPSKTDRPVIRAAALFMLLPLIVSLLFPAMREAWLDLTSVSLRMTYLEQAPELIVRQQRDAMSSVAEVLFGNGVGTYGLSFFGSSFSGTHNMFLDMFFSGGIVQLIAFLALMAHPVIKTMRSYKSGTVAIVQTLSCMAIASTVILSFREFDLNYLGVSSLPALLVGWFVGAAERPADDAKLNNVDVG